MYKFFTAYVGTESVSISADQRGNWAMTVRGRTVEDTGDDRHEIKILLPGIKNTYEAERLLALIEEGAAE